MPKSIQTPSKAKLSSNAEAKSKNMKPKSKKSVKSSSEPAPTPAPSPSISSTVPTSSSNVKATPRKSIRKVPNATTQVDTVVKKAVVHGESVPVIANQVQIPPSKLVFFVSAIDDAPLATRSPTSGKPQMEEFTVEEGADNLGKEHNAQDIANEEEMSKNEGGFGDEKESDTDDNIGEQVNDSAEEETHSKEEDNSESKGKDQEKVSESEVVDEESEEENENMSEES
nr:uncharacterized protein LOC104118321 [Nicotiana tomentosiformis]